jgi:hypothetical protein
MIWLSCGRSVNSVYGRQLPRRVFAPHLQKRVASKNRHIYNGSFPSTGMLTMSDAGEFRRKSTLFRRIASIATSGGHSADRVLIHLAERLEHEAALAERQSSPNFPQPSTADGGVRGHRSWTS